MKHSHAQKNQDRGFSYSRTANPTVSALEAKVAGLEGAAGGACCFSTGMAATVTVMSAFLKAGESNSCFGSRPTCSNSCWFLCICYRNSLRPLDVLCCGVP